MGAIEGWRGIAPSGARTTKTGPPARQPGLLAGGAYVP